jgi:hypothetical protein
MKKKKKKRKKMKQTPAMQNQEDRSRLYLDRL